tara:strand:- start:50 stop:1372 length:1323 start_codon:yes stop_codon:yes gene_type:complete
MASQVPGYSKPFPGPGAPAGYYILEGVGERYYTKEGKWRYGSPGSSGQVTIPGANLPAAFNQWVGQWGLGTSERASRAVDRMTKTGYGLHTKDKKPSNTDTNKPVTSSGNAETNIPAGPPVPRVNGNGVVQTQHSSGITQQSISEINNSLGVTVRDPFASVALPVTEQGYLQFNEPMPKGDSGYPEGYDQLLGSGGAVEWRSDDVNNPADSPGKVVSTGNNGVLIGEDGLPVNNPFLSYEGPGGSMGALRAKEAVSGIVHAAGGDRGGVSGSKWLREGEKLVPISNENAQILMTGGDPAQQFLDNWKTKVTPSGVDLPPDQNQQDELSRALAQHQAWEKQQLGHGPNVYAATEGPVTLESFQPYATEHPMDAQGMFYQYQDLHGDHGKTKADAFAIATGQRPELSEYAGKFEEFNAVKNKLFEDAFPKATGFKGVNLLGK